MVHTMSRGLSVGRAALLVVGGFGFGALQAAKSGAEGAPELAVTVPERDLGPLGESADPREREPERERDPDREDEADQAGELVGDGELRGVLALASMFEDEGELIAPLVGGGEAVLTLEPEAQDAAERVLERANPEVGAIVAMSMEGDILAYAGRRNIDPAREQDWQLPAQVWAPAASVFKVVTAGALVSAGVEPSREVCFHGGGRSIESEHLQDHPLDHRCEDLAFGVSHSGNAVMAKLAHRHLDATTLSDYAGRFGFYEAPDFAIEADAGRARIPEEPLEFARVAAGFWHTEISALGGATLAGVVASGGLKVAPRIVDRVVEPSGHIREVVPEEPERTLDPHVASHVGDMMVGTTVSGTARRAFSARQYLPGIRVAGKTGTLTRRDPSHIGYSWFVGFAPADDPEVAIAVVLGNPPAWTLRGHTAARMVLQSLL